MRSLVEIFREANRIEKELIESRGELTPCLEAELLITKDQLSKKIDSYDFIINNFESKCDFYREMASKYSDAAESVENYSNRLKDRIKFVMMESGMRELEGETVKYKISSSMPRLVIDDESKIPDKYKIITTQIDKQPLKRDLKNIKIPGARLEETCALRAFVKTTL